MIRCKVCGYIMFGGKLGDKCPACGAPKTAFEPYTDPMAAPRRKILNLQFHPIAVHFPITFTVAAFVFSLAILFLSGEAKELLVSSNKVIALFVPVLVIIAGLVGWVDGRVRFRKIKNSQILKRKIFYAIFLFVISIGLTLIIWTGEFSTLVFTLVAILLSAAATVLIYLLGLLGTSITGAAFPGK